jgi:4-amino-4-deoxy-L-arabinose transferase-like glycosyltransferase
MSASELDRRPDSRGLAVLAALIVVLAVLLRFWRLGDWNFQATEIFTLRDSVRPQFHNPRPLGYLLNYYLIRPLMPLDEFGLRLLPAVFGALAVPVFYLVSRRLVGSRAALLGTLLLAINPLLISYSQLARYWSLVFLLSTVFPYAIYLGVRDRNRPTLVLGLVTFVLAVLAHPVSALLIVGPVLALLARTRRDQVARLWSQKAVRWSVVVLLVLVALVVVRLTPMFQHWVSEHDKNPGSGQFLNPSSGPSAFKLLVYLIAFADGLSLPVALTGLVGLYLLWQGRDRPLAVFLTSLAGFPIVFLTLISLRTPVSTYYLLPTVPVFFMGAGLFLDRIFEVDWKVRPWWLVPATLTALVVAFGVPTLVSDYRNGRRYDFREAARWIEQHSMAGDIVYSDQPIVLTHYLTGKKVERLRYNVAPLTESLRAARQSGPDGALWIVAPGLSHALRTNLKQGGLIRWIYDHCQLTNTVGVGRIDFRQQYLQVYRCPPSLSSP